MTATQTAGILVMQGGGPFAASDALDAALLAEVGASRVVVLPTADAFETPGDLVAAAQAWGARLGVEVEGMMVLTRGDALDAANAARLTGARAVYLVGDSPIHLRSVMTDTPVWEAITQVYAAGGLVVGVGGSAAALCDPMTDPRGGAFTIGLGLVSGMAAATETETWTEERLARTRKLADVAVVELPTGSAAIKRSEGWELHGDAVVHGSLPV